MLARPRCRSAGNCGSRLGPGCALTRGFFWRSYAATEALLQKRIHWSLVRWACSETSPRRAGRPATRRKFLVLGAENIRVLSTPSFVLRVGHPRRCPGPRPRARERAPTDAGTADQGLPSRLSTGHPCTRNTRNTKVPASDHPIWTPRPTPRSLLRRRTVAPAPASASVNHVARGAFDGRAAVPPGHRRDIRTHRRNIRTQAAASRSARASA